jgi:hypothetical protein
LCYLLPELGKEVAFLCFLSKHSAICCQGWGRRWPSLVSCPNIPQSAARVGEGGGLPLFPVQTFRYLLPGLGKEVAFPCFLSKHSAICCQGWGRRWPSLVSCPKNIFILQVGSSVNNYPTTQDIHKAPHDWKLSDQMKSFISHEL